MAVLKFLFFFFLLGVALAGKPTIEEMKASRAKCQKTYPILDKEIDEIHQNKCSPNADRLLKMYVTCYMKSEKLMDDKGHFDVERMYDLMILKHQHELKRDPKDAMVECTKNRKETIMYERAWNTLKCFADKKLW